MPHDDDDFSLRHEIFVLDAHIHEPLDISKREEITRRIVDDLLISTRMLKLGPLEIYAATDDRAPGWSFIQAITTSHMSAHYFEKPGRLPHIRFDMYSCEEVHWKTIVDVVHKHLRLADWRATFVEREIEPGSMRKIKDICGEGGTILRENTMATEAFAETTQRVKDEHVEKSTKKKAAAK